MNVWARTLTALALALWACGVHAERVGVAMPDRVQPMTHSAAALAEFDVFLFLASRASQSGSR